MSNLLEMRDTGKCVARKRVHCLKCLDYVPRQVPSLVGPCVYIMCRDKVAVAISFSIWYTIFYWNFEGEQQKKVDLKFWTIFIRNK